MFTRTQQLLAAATLGLMSVGSAQAEQLNPDYGVDFYAASFRDMNHERSLVHFTSSVPYRLERINNFFIDDDYELQAFRCGAYTPNGYVGYITRLYTFVEYPDAFVKMDLRTGSYNTLLDMSDDSVYGPNWPVITDLDYDWCNGVLYGMGRGTTNYGENTSTLYTVDPYTGNYTLVCSDLGQISLAMAIDYDGYFYFIGMEGDSEGNVIGTSLYKKELDMYGNMNTIWRKTLTVNGEAFPVYYLNDMTFDYTTGDLYWAADQKDVNWQNLVRIEPETGVTTNLGKIGTWESVVGLYIPFTTADDREAPAAVKDVEVSYANAGQSVTLAWTNPTTRWDRETLTNLGQVIIARDTKDNVVATLDATGREGERMNWTDTEATQGIHTYYFIAKNAAGKGIVKDFRAQAGADTPGEVFGLSVTAESDEDVAIRWAKPEKGEHEGWYDETTVTYDVVRQPDGAIVAKGITETTIHDTNLGEYDSYYYEVTASNAAGRGAKTTSRSVQAGHSLTAPYIASFNSQQDADRWTVIDANGDGKTWEWIGQNGVAEYQRMNLNSESMDDDLLVSPKLKVEEGKTYRVSVDVFMDWKNQYTFQIRQGESKLLEDLELVDIFHYDINEGDPEYVTVTFEGTFEAYHTGEHYIAFRSLSNNAISNIGVYQIRFEEVPAHDLAMGQVDLLPDAIQGQASTATVRVLNRGLESVKASEYSVEAYNVETGEVWGSAPGRYTVRPDEHEEVTVEFTPTTAGNQKIAFRTVCSLDDNAANNSSAPVSITVTAAGADAWNVDITENEFRGEDFGANTRVPIDFMSIYSIQQSIYDASTIGIEGDITRIGYRYSTNDSFRGYPMVSISLGTTTLDGYKSASQALGTDALTNVYYGAMEIDHEYGDHVIAFDCDTPFHIGKGQNLVVQIEKEGDVGSMWPMVFPCFNLNSSTSKGNYGTVRASSDKSMPAIANGVCLEYIPQLLLAINTKSGIQTVVLEPVGNGTYDLLGRPATTVENGLFIQNGKKVVK